MGNPPTTAKGRAAATVLGVVLCLAALSHPAAVPSQAGGQPPVNGLVVGFTRTMFPDINPTEAVAAITVWARDLSANLGYTDPAKVMVFDDITSMAEALARVQLSIFVMSVPEYLSVRRRLGIQAECVGQNSGLTAWRVQIVVRRDSGVDRIEQLKGRELLVLNDAVGSVGKVWLETQVLQQGAAGLDAYFGPVRLVTKGSQALLPVFFRQAPAAFVSETALATMIELNPQLGRDLKAIASSPPMVPSVVGVAPQYDPPRRAALAQGLFSLHQNPRGQQSLMLFKLQKLVPFEASLLQSVEELIAEHSRLRARSARDTGRI